MKTPIARVTRSDRGHLRGHPVRFLPGHHNRIRRGELAPRWKGGRYRMMNGYIAAYDPDRRTHVLEHRLIMERQLGRPLEKGEIVHHINGVKDDNRLENLVVTNSSDHALAHGFGTWMRTKRPAQ